MANSKDGASVDRCNVENVLEVNHGPVQCSISGAVFLAHFDQYDIHACISSVVQDSILVKNSRDLTADRCHSDEICHLLFSQ